MTIYNREAIPYCNLGGKSWSQRPEGCGERTSGHYGQVYVAQRNSKRDIMTGHEEERKYSVCHSCLLEHFSTWNVIAIPLSGGEESRSMTLVISKKQFVCFLCRSLATVKDMKLANPLEKIMWAIWKVIKSSAISDWYCQHSGDVHKNLSKVTRCSFSPCALCERLACKTR